VGEGCHCDVGDLRRKGEVIRELTKTAMRFRTSDITAAVCWYCVGLGGADTRVSVIANTDMSDPDEGVQ
jgi:hypothetical protein